MSGLPVYMYTTCVPDTHRSQKRVLDDLEHGDCEPPCDVGSSGTADSVLNHWIVSSAQTWIFLSIQEMEIFKLL